MPSLESLCLNAVAAAVHEFEPEQLFQLPYGGSERIIDRLVLTGRLRPETLVPLLRAADLDTEGVELRRRIGGGLAGAAATGSRGLAALAASRLSHAAARRDRRVGGGLPHGTLRADCERARHAEAARRSATAAEREPDGCDACGPRDGGGGRAAAAPAAPAG